MNKTEFKNISAFHPGYYISDLINDLEMSQEEFALRLGVTPKNLSDLVNGKASISKNIAKNKIFKEPRKTTLEIGSYTVFEKLLDTLIPAAYERVYLKAEHETFKTKRVIDLLGVNAPKKEADLYTSYQAIVDFVSGMTDDYATLISSQFSGAGK